MNLKIIQTSDGSDTIYNSELNETYHSLHGSVNESNTVYIQNGLEYYIKKKSKYFEFIIIKFLILHRHVLHMTLFLFHSNFSRSI